MNHRLYEAKMETINEEVKEEEDDDDDDDDDDNDDEEDEEKEDGTKLETYFVERKYQYKKRIFPLDYSKKNKRIMNNLSKANKKKKESKKTNYENFHKNK